jgi:uncharacterized membrane protein
VQEPVSQLVRNVSLILEVVAVAIILAGFTAAVIDAIRIWRRTKDRHKTYVAARRLSSRSLLFALEVLLAADIIHTTTVMPTIENMLALGLLVLIRTFLSWAIDVDLDGYWPWQRWRLTQQFHKQPPVD